MKDCKYNKHHIDINIIILILILMGLVSKDIEKSLAILICLWTTQIPLTLSILSPYKHSFPHPHSPHPFLISSLSIFSSTQVQSLPFFSLKIPFSHLSFHSILTLPSLFLFFQAPFQWLQPPLPSRRPCPPPPPSPPAQGGRGKPMPILFLGLTPLVAWKLTTMSSP